MSNDAASSLVVPPAEAGVLRIERSRGLARLNLRELWRFRDLFLALAHRDVKLRYRQTALGVLWVLLQPLLAAGVFSIVFGMVAKIDAGPVPYFLFAYAGQVAWQTFASTLGKTSGCLVQNSQLVSKVYFPRLVLPLSTTVSTLIDTAIALVALGVLAAAMGHGFGLPLLTLPLWLGVAMTLGIGIGLYTSALMVSYRDVQFILPVATQILLYASPVAYPMSAVPAEIRSLYWFNPVTGLMEGCRWSLLGGAAPETALVAYSVACTVAVLGAGIVNFKRMERRFADVI